MNIEQFQEKTTLIQENEQLVQEIRVVEKDAVKQLQLIYAERSTDDVHQQTMKEWVRLIFDKPTIAKEMYSVVIDEGFDKLAVFQQSHPYSYSLQDAFVIIMDRLYEHDHFYQEDKDLMFVTMDAFLYHLPHIATQELVRYFQENKQFLDSSEFYDAFCRIDTFLDQDLQVNFAFEHLNLTNTLQRLAKQPQMIKKENILQERENMLITLLFSYELLGRKEDIDRLTKDMIHANQIKEVIASIVTTFYQFISSVPTHIVKTFDREFVGMQLAI